MLKRNTLLTTGLIAALAAVVAPPSEAGNPRGNLQQVHWSANHSRIIGAGGYSIRILMTCPTIVDDQHHSFDLRMLGVASTVEPVEMSVDGSTDNFVVDTSAVGTLMNSNVLAESGLVQLTATRSIRFFYTAFGTTEVQVRAAGSKPRECDISLEAADSGP